MSIYIKDPDAVLDYTVDWTSWLAAAETVSTSTWVVEAGITQNSASNDTTSGTIWLSGGTVGEEYRVTNRVATNQGRTDDRTILIRVKER